MGDGYSTTLSGDGPHDKDYIETALGADVPSYHPGEENSDGFEVVFEAKFAGTYPLDREQTALAAAQFILGQPKEI